MEERGLKHSVRPLAEAYSRVSNEDHRGTRLADEARPPQKKPPKTITLDARVRILLLQLIQGVPSMVNISSYASEALELEKIPISGVIYASEKSLPRDSNIIFHRPGGSSQRVGRIKSIFQVCYQPGVTFLAVSQHNLITSSHEGNVYRRFGFAGGLLCEAEENGRLLVIRSEDVICHFAKTDFELKGDKLMHALPLNTVCNLLEYQRLD